MKAVGRFETLAGVALLSRAGATAGIVLLGKQRKVILTGGDTSANDAQPMGEEDGYAVPCHTEMQTRRGIWNIENLEFTPLLKDRVYEFLFVWSPLKIVGSTGSPGNPVALY